MIGTHTTDNCCDTTTTFYFYENDPHPLAIVRLPQEPVEFGGAALEDVDGSRQGQSPHDGALDDIALHGTPGRWGDA